MNAQAVQGTGSNLTMLAFPKTKPKVSCSPRVISMQAWRSNCLFVIKGSILPSCHPSHRSTQASKSFIAAVSR